MNNVVCFGSRRDVMVYWWKLWRESKKERGADEKREIWSFKKKSESCFSFLLESSTKCTRSVHVANFTEAG